MRDEHFRALTTAESREKIWPLEYTSYLKQQSLQPQTSSRQQPTDESFTLGSSMSQMPDPPLRN